MGVVKRHGIHIFMAALLCLLAAVLLLAYTSEDSNKRVIRISNGQSMDHPDNIGLTAFKEYIEERLGDKYEIEIYPNELLGSSAKALELLQTGAIEYVVCSTSNLESFNDVYQLFSLPYLFADEDGYHKVMADQELMETIYSSTDDSGFRVVAALEAGVRNIYSKKPIYTSDDLKGMKIRVQPSQTNIQMINLMGGTGIAMSYSEVYTGLQSGVIDGAENSEMALTTMKHGEVAPYYTYTQHQIVPDMLVANVKFLEELSEEETAIFQEAVEVCAQTEAQARARQIQEAKAEAEAMGVTFVETDIAAFRELVLPLHTEVLEKNTKLQPYYERIQVIQDEEDSAEE